MVRLLAQSLERTEEANEFQTVARTSCFCWNRDGGNLGVLLFIYQRDPRYTFPLQLLGFRFGAAALFLTILKLTGLVQINLKGKPTSSLLLLALFQPGLYFIGETWGVKWTSASEAGMVIALVPVAIATMAAIFFSGRAVWLDSCSRYNSDYFRSLGYEYLWQDCFATTHGECLIILIQTGYTKEVCI
ncbi:MAG TPA: DMT family transporter [Desulfosporosinus sp.]|nr:DMT family transporter [Desulfosporosinus sp.]